MKCLSVSIYWVIFSICQNTNIYPENLFHRCVHENALLVSRATGMYSYILPILMSISEEILCFSQKLKMQDVKCQNFTFRSLYIS